MNESFSKVNLQLIELKEISNKNKVNQLSLQNELNALNTFSHEQKNKIAALQLQLLKAASEFNNQQIYNPKKWQMAEALYLIKLAQQRIVLEQDAVGAINILKAGDKILLDTQDVGLMLVRQQLAKDILALNSVQAEDLQGIYLRLNVLAEKVSAFEFTSGVSQLEREEEPKMGVIEEMRAFISIKKVNPDFSIQLDPTLFYLTQQSLLLNIEQMQLAITSKNQLLFSQSIKQGLNKLKEHFANQYGFSSIKEELLNLERSVIKHTLPNVLDTVNMLEAYIYQLDEEKTTEDIKSEENQNSES